MSLYGDRCLLLERLAPDPAAGLSDCARLRNHPACAALANKRRRGDCQGGCQPSSSEMSAVRSSDGGDHQHRSFRSGSPATHIRMPSLWFSDVTYRGDHAIDQGTRSWVKALSRAAPGEPSDAAHSPSRHVSRIDDDCDVFDGDRDVGGIYRANAHWELWFWGMSFVTNGPPHLAASSSFQAHGSSTWNGITPGAAEVANIETAPIAGRRSEPT